MERRGMRLGVRVFTIIVIVACTCAAGLAFLLAWAGSLADTSPRENRGALLFGGSAGLWLVVNAVGLCFAMVGRRTRRWCVAVIGVNVVGLGPFLLLSPSLPWEMGGARALGAAALCLLPLLCVASAALLYITASPRAEVEAQREPGRWTTAIQVASGWAALLSIVNGVAFVMAGLVFALGGGIPGERAVIAGVVGAAAHVVMAIAMIVALQLRRPTSRGATWVVLLVSGGALSAVITVAGQHGAGALLLGAAPSVNVLCGLGLLRSALRVEPRDGKCRGCGYSLEGLPGMSVCPECGKPVG